MDANFSLAGKRIFVAGHRGMVGAAVKRKLEGLGHEVVVASRSQADLTRQDETERFLEQTRPNVVVIAAAKVGGIHANATFPRDFLYENLAITSNLIEASHKVGVEKLLNLGSSCIYPRLAEQPMREDALLTGPLEPTNEWYAIAKIAGIKLCQAYRRQYGSDFISLMPTNLYGPGDNYHPEHSHVVGALLLRFHEAKQANAPVVTIWGTGTPLREFLYVDDLAEACVFVLERYSGDDHLNCGSGSEVTIAELARTIARVVGYEGRVELDPTKPDGTPRKLMDNSRLAEMGWVATTGLEQGLRLAYEAYLAGQGRYIASSRAHAEAQVA